MKKIDYGNLLVYLVIILATWYIWKNIIKFFKYTIG